MPRECNASLPLEMETLFDDPASVVRQDVAACVGPAAGLQNSVSIPQSMRGGKELAHFCTSSSCAPAHRAASMETLPRAHGCLFRLEAHFAGTADFAREHSREESPAALIHLGDLRRQSMIPGSPSCAHRCTISLRDIGICDDDRWKNFLAASRHFPGPSDSAPPQSTSSSLTPASLHRHRMRAV